MANPPRHIGPTRCQYPGCSRLTVRKGDRGVYPRYCPEHREVQMGASGNRAKVVRRAAERGDDGAEELARRLGVSLDGHKRPTGTAALEHFAVLLGVTSSARKAADLAGLAVGDEELVELEAQARAEHPELVEGRQTAATALANGALLLLLLRLRDVAPALPPAQTAAALRQVGDVLDRLQGGLQPVYSEVRVVLDLPEVPE